MKLFILGICVFCIFQLNAQKVAVTWSEPTKDEYNYYSFFRGAGNDMIKISVAPVKMFQLIKVKPLLSRYNETLQVQAEHEYDLGDRQTELDDFMYLGGNIFLITHLYEKSAEATTYSAQAINYKTLEPVGLPKTIASFDASRRNKQSKVQFRKSLDTTKLLVFSTAAYDKNSNQQYYFAVFDKSMKKLWEKSLELPILDKFVDVMDIALTNDGKVAVLLKHFDKDVTKENVKEDGANVPSYSTKLLVFENKVVKPQEYIIDLGNKFVQNLYITDDNASGLDLFGLYKNKYNGYISGYFTCNLETKTLQIRTKKMEAFSDDLVKLVSTDKFGSDKESDPGISSSFSLKSKMERNSFGTDYLLEYYKVIVHTSYNSTTNSTTTSYEYVKGDIIDIFLPKQGNTVVSRIPKYQRAGSVLYEGFASLPYNDTMLFFYNDDKDNLTQDITKRPDDVRKFSKSILMMAAVSINGNVSRSMVVDNKEEDLTSCPGLSSILDNKRIITYSRKGLGVFGAAKEYVGVLQIQ